VGAGDYVGSDETVTNSLTSIGSGPHGGVNGTGFAADEDGHITATDKLTTDEAHFGRLRHGIGCFYGGDEAAGLNHAEGDAHGFVCHYLLQGEGWNVRQ